MCRKHLEPYQCEFVPEVDIVVFCIRNKHLLEAVHKRHEEYRKSISRHGLKRSYVFSSPVGKALSALLLLTYNFKDSYLSSSDAQTRVMCIYRENRDKIWSTNE